MKKYNPYHLVDLSPWPFLGSLSIFRFFLRVIIMVRYYSCLFFFISLLTIFVLSYLWGKDIHREACYMGYHNQEAVVGFKFGMIIFILSECFFFFRIFWSYLHLAQSPALDLGGVWPPVGVHRFDPKGVPFLNTLFLVSSGVSVTWCHHSVETGDYKTSVFSLFLTIFLGAVFSFCQGIEYYVARFTFSCSAYSSIYFMGTGFHGLHVIIGRILLLLSLFRFIGFNNRPTRIAGFECSVWY